MNRCKKTTFPSLPSGLVRAVVEKPCFLTSAAYTLWSMFAQIWPTPAVSVYKRIKARDVEELTMNGSGDVESFESKRIDLTVELLEKPISSLQESLTGQRSMGVFEYQTRYS